MANDSHQTLEQWAGANRLNLALVFTDIISSTAIGQKLGDERWVIELAKHFEIGRELAGKFDCFVVKVIGDAFFIAFRNSTDAVEFAEKFSMNTGVAFVGIRVGIHQGQVQILENDIYGLNVNMTARIQSSSLEEGIHVSDSIKNDFVNVKGNIRGYVFNPIQTPIKNFPRSKTWRFVTRDLNSATRDTRENRNSLLGIVNEKSAVPATQPRQLPQLKIPKD